MVVAERIQTVKDYIAAGHDVFLSYSTGRYNDALKLKVTISAGAGVTAIPVRALVLSTLAGFEQSLTSCVVTDHGHKFSDGHCVASFWVRPQRGISSSNAGSEDGFDKDNDGDDSCDHHMDRSRRRSYTAHVQGNHPRATQDNKQALTPRSNKKPRTQVHYVEKIQVVEKVEYIIVEKLVVVPQAQAAEKIVEVASAGADGSEVQTLESFLADVCMKSDDEIPQEHPVEVQKFDVAQLRTLVAPTVEAATGSMADVLGDMSLVHGDDAAKSDEVRELGLFAVSEMVENGANESERKRRSAMAHHCPEEGGTNPTDNERPAKRVSFSFAANSTVEFVPDEIAIESNIDRDIDEAEQLGAQLDEVRAQLASAMSVCSMLSTLDDFSQTEVNGIQEKLAQSLGKFASSQRAPPLPHELSDIQTQLTALSDIGVSLTNADDQIKSLRRKMTILSQLTDGPHSCLAPSLGASLDSCLEEIDGICASRGQLRASFNNVISKLGVDTLAAESG